jgi:hypothetical protein
LEEPSSDHFMPLSPRGPGHPSHNDFPYEDRALKNLKDGYNFDESRKFSVVLLNGLNGNSEEWEKIFRTRIAAKRCGMLSPQTCVAYVLRTRDPLLRGDPADYAWQNNSETYANQMYLQDSNTSTWRIRL